MNTLQMLVVDADPARREVTLASLRGLGLSLHGCASGEEALAAFEPGRYHVILLDDELPEMDLYDTVTAIRNREAHADHAFVPAHLIAVFPRLGTDTRKQAFAFDINHCLRHPLRQKTLRNILERVAHFRTHLRAPTPHSGPSLDGEMLNTLLEDEGLREPHLFVALVDLFLSNIPPLLRHFNDAIERHDDRAIRVISRKLQGSCLSVGAHGIIHLCEEILGARRRQHSPEGFRFLLNEEFTRVVSRLHHLREQEVCALEMDGEFS